MKIVWTMSLQKKKHLKNVSTKTDHQKTYVQSTSKKDYLVLMEKENI